MAKRKRKVIEPAETVIRVRKLVKPLAAVLGVGATMASIWWFALKPRRTPKD